MTADVAPVVDLRMARLVDIEQRIAGATEADLRSRWEFGHELLAARDGKGRLPNGYLVEVVERTGCSRAELGHRQRFAERFPTEAELTNAISTFGSWYQVVNVGLARADGAAAPPAPPIIPTGTYGTIVADPPWRYGNTSTRGAAEDHYETMSIADLCALDVARDRAAPQSHLYLWTTAGHLPEAFTVMEAWGFEYKTYLVWVKPQMGMGNYFRVSTELVLFGVRGGLRTSARDIMNYFEARRAKHSAKPRAFRAIVQKASPGPYLELFSRCNSDRQLVCDCSKCADGWDVWGDQA